MNTRKIESIQALRAFAFLEIFLYHCGVKVFSGALGVSIFFVLSGFCMSVNHLPKIKEMKLSIVENITWGILKIKKLYPIHILMMFVVLILNKFNITFEDVRMIIPNILLYKCLLPDLSSCFSWYGVSWFLSTYMFICIMALPIMKCIDKIEKEKIIALLILLLMTMIFIGSILSFINIKIGENFAYYFTYVSPIYRGGEFCIGVVLGKLWIENNGEEKKNICVSLIEILWLIVLIISLVLYQKAEGVLEGIRYTILFTPVSIFGIILFVKNEGCLIKILNNKFLRYLGDLSAYMFLPHQIIIAGVQIILGKMGSESGYRIILIIMSLIINVIFAEVYIRFDICGIIEKLWMQRIKRYN